MPVKSEEINKWIDETYRDLRCLKHISEYVYRKQRYEYYKQWIEADSDEKREIKYYDDPSDYATNLLDEYKDRFIFESKKVSEWPNELIGKEFFLGLSVELKCIIFSDVVNGNKKIAKQLFDSLGKKIQGTVLKGVVENHDNFDIGSCDIELINPVLINLAKQMTESIFDNFPDELKVKILDSCNGDLLVRINNLGSNCNYALDVGSFEDQKELLRNSVLNSVKIAFKNKIVNKESFKAKLICSFDVYNDGTNYDKGNSSYMKKLNGLKDWVIDPEKVSVPNDAMIALNYLYPWYEKWYDKSCDAEIKTKLEENNLVNGGQYSQVEVDVPSVHDLCKHIEKIKKIPERIKLAKEEAGSDCEPEEFLTELEKKGLKDIVERISVELLKMVSYTWVKYLYNRKDKQSTKKEEQIAQKNKQKSEVEIKKESSTTAEEERIKEAFADNSRNRFVKAQEDFDLTVSGAAFTNAIIELIGRKGEGEEKKFSEIYRQHIKAAKNKYGRIDNNGREILRSDDSTRSMLNNCRDVINELKKNNKLSLEDEALDKVLKNITYNKTVILINEANLDETEKKNYLGKIEPSKSASMDEEIDGRRVIEPSYQDRYSYEGDNTDIVSGVISNWVRFVKSKGNLKLEEFENLRNYFSYTIFTVKDTDSINNFFAALSSVYNSGIEEDKQCFNWEIIGYIAGYYNKNHKIPNRDEVAIQVFAAKDLKQGSDKEVFDKKIKKSFANKCDNVRKKYASDFKKYCMGY